MAPETWGAYTLLETLLEEEAARQVDRLQSAKLAEIRRKAIECVRAGALATMRSVEAVGVGVGVCFDAHQHVAIDEQAIRFFAAARDLIGVLAEAERESFALRPRAAKGRQTCGRPKKLEEGVKQLTCQQLRVLDLLLDGLPNKLIAYELRLSETTVKAHVSGVLRKLNVPSRSRAIALFAIDAPS